MILSTPGLYNHDCLNTQTNLSLKGPAQAKKPLYWIWNPIKQTHEHIHI